ncbi:MAG: glycosyltransferase family 4 protein [Eubacteriales bacterium]
MKKILLVSNHVFHYRQKLYNYFQKKFNEDGYELYVLSNSFQEVDFSTEYKKYETKMSITNYVKLLDEIKPDVVILFLHLKDYVMLPLIYSCKIKKIPVIYWNHGINIKTPESKIKNALFYFIHSCCDALITYTPEMKKYFSEKSQRKLFVAYNTIDLSDIDKNEICNPSECKSKYGIKEKNVILYVSRLKTYKRPELLIELFGGMEDIAVVLVGPDETDEFLMKVSAFDNVYYLGEKYGIEVDEIYKMADIFSTPGHIGLALNQAMFWGVPVVLLEGIHAPEIYYLKDNITGKIAVNEEVLKEYVLALLNDKEQLESMSAAALDVYEKEISIDRMYEGFKEAIKYCEGNYTNK